MSNFESPAALVIRASVTRVWTEILTFELPASLALVWNWRAGRAAVRADLPGVAHLAALLQGPLGSCLGAGGTLHVSCALIGQFCNRPRHSLIEPKL